MLTLKKLQQSGTPFSSGIEFQAGGNQAEPGTLLIGLDELENPLLKCVPLRWTATSRYGDAYPERKLEAVRIFENKPLSLGVLNYPGDEKRSGRRCDLTRNSWSMLLVVGLTTILACGDTASPESVAVGETADSTEVTAATPESVQATSTAEPTATPEMVKTSTPEPSATPMPTAIATPTSQSFYELGQESLADGDIENARAHLSKAIELNPQYAEAYFFRALIFGREKDYDNAIADFEKFVELDPSHPDAKTALAGIYAARGADFGLKKDYDKAIADIERAIELDPENSSMKFAAAGTFLLRGLTFFGEDNFREAIADFDRLIETSEEAFELDSSRTEARMVVASAYFLRGLAHYEEGDNLRTLADFDGAIESLREFIRIAPDNADAKVALVDSYILRGVVYSEESEYDKALADFERVLEVYPGDTNFDEVRQDAQNEIAKISIERNEGIEWTLCEGRLKCGFVEVPADYHHPDAGGIRVAVNVRRADNQAERIGYLFVNPGGPGGSGLELVQNSDFVFGAEILERFDVVGFDPRGVGKSEPEFACGGPGEQLALLNSIDGETDTPEEIAAGEAAAILCIESMGPVAGLLHSEYVARDMEEIRIALGAEQISYLGFSYGSALGVWYATLFPDSVRAMVVDGADNPVDKADTQQDRMDEALEEAMPFEEQLRAALTSCDSPECPIYNGGDPIGYYYRAAEKLHLVNSAVGGVPYAAYLGVLSTLYDEAEWPSLWQGLYELYEEDDPMILVDFVEWQLDDEPTAANFTSHVNCLDGFVLKPHLDRATRLDDSQVFEAISELELPLIEAADFDSASACPFYDQFAPKPLDVPLDGGGVPILVIGNHTDPATSFGESEELVTETLSNGHLLETSHASHVVYPDNDCVNEHVHRALIEAVYPDERVFCERED